MAGIKQYDEKPEIVATMESVGVEFKIHAGQNRGTVRCPFHGDTGRPNMSVWVESQTFYCFNCNRGGDVYDFLGLTLFGDRWNPRDRGMFLEVVGNKKLEKISRSKPLPKSTQIKAPSRETIQALGLAA